MKPAMSAAGPQVIKAPCQQDPQRRSAEPDKLRNNGHPAGARHKWRVNTRIALCCDAVTVVNEPPDFHHQWVSKLHLCDCEQHLSPDLSLSTVGQADNANAHWLRPNSLANNRPSISW
jgi:hypothetical protein